MKRIYTSLIATMTLVFGLLLASAYGAIKQVRVANDTDTVIYIHKGGFAPSVSVMPGQSKIFPYPFVVHPPGHHKPIKSSMIVASTGGRWVIKSDGYTYLKDPTLLLCLDYASREHVHKTGNRVWTIKRATGFDRNCRVEGYKQAWHQKKKPPVVKPEPHEQKIDTR